jgi:DNA-directed RNA polymerase specialized sigma24 family protein
MTLALAPADEVSAEIAAMRPALAAAARKLTADEDQADLLVDAVILQAQAAPAGTPTQASLFAMMRRVFHSVERRRGMDRTRRMPDRPWNLERAALFVIANRSSPT